VLLAIPEIMRRWVFETIRDSVAATDIKRSLGVPLLHCVLAAALPSRMHTLSIEQADNEIPIFRRGGQSTIPGIHGAIVQCLLMEE
jgi:hypothetical protein